MEYKPKGVIGVAFLEKVMKKEDEINIEDFLNNMDEKEEMTYEDADAFVKPMQLERDEDVAPIVMEAKAGNIVLIDMGGLKKRNALKLKDLLSHIKAEITMINGDLAGISDTRILVTPSRVKIIKRKE